jgi:Phage gp6-like head-tail connector protein
MPTIQITPPGTEPVTLAEAKLHLRLESSFTDDDTKVSQLIVMARKAAEDYTRRSLITQQWKLVCDQFPAPGINIGSANWYGPQYGTSPGPMTTLRPEGSTGFEIFLDHCPVQTVDSITYTDGDGNAQTLSPSLYKLDTITEPCRIVPAYGTTWPATRNEINAVSVSYTTGYGNASAVPDPIKGWMLLRIGAMYENREEIVVGSRLASVDLPFVDGLLQPYRVLGY